MHYPGTCTFYVLHVSTSPCFCTDSKSPSQILQTGFNSVIATRLGTSIHPPLKTASLLTVTSVYTQLYPYYYSVCVCLVPGCLYMYCVQQYISIIDIAITALQYVLTVTLQSQTWTIDHCCMKS